MIGASYSSDLAAGFAAVGHPEAAATAASYAETVRQSYQMAVDYINQQGGFHGCPVQLAFHDFKSLGASGFDGESQQECTDFTQDQPVSFVYAAGLESRVLVECLHQHGVAVHISYFSPDQPDYDTYRGTLYQPDALSVSRYGPFIDQFAAAGYFDGQGTKVGILVGDDGTGSRPRMVNDLWVPQLKARGLDPVVFNYQVINGYSDVSRVTTVFGQAVLQFKGQGVNHVLIPPDQGNAAIFFTQAAESQGYRPRYGITSESAASTWYSVPAGQRTGTVAISYTVFDVFANQALVDQNPATPARQWCQALYIPQNLQVDYRWCDLLQFLQDAFANEDPSHDALLRGTEALGNSHQSASGIGATFFGPGRYDGAAQIRAMAWDDGAGDWSYVGPVVDVP